MAQVLHCLCYCQHTMLTLPITLSAGIPPSLQGTPSAEVQAIAAASSHARGSTAYLNMETGDCHGDSASLSALIGAGVSRVVVGIRHPLAHSRGLAIKELRQHGVHVDVLGETACFEAADWEDSTIHKCLAVNEVTVLMHVHAAIAAS